MDRKERKAFSLIARVGSFKHAFRGIGIFVSRTHNAWIEIVYSTIVIGLGCYFKIGEGEWLALIISLGVLLAAEAFNTAMEVHMDLTSPEFHPYARDTKDIAAGAVLITVFATVAVSVIIFLPKLIAL